MQRDIVVAEAIGELKEAVKATTRAVEAGNAALEKHVGEQRTEGLLLKREIETELRDIKSRLSILEGIHKREDAQREQVSKWARILHLVLGGVITAGMIWVLEWLKSAVAAAHVARPSVLAFAALVTAWAVLFALPALSATYYVAPGGSNTAAGTIDAPWASINYAATRVTLGDIVMIRCGTYAESVRTTQHGAAGRPILYQADTRGCARIVPPPNNNSATAWAVESNYTTVDGVEIDGSAHQSGARWAIGIRMAGIYNTVTGAVVHDIGRAGTCSESGYGIGSDGLAGAEYAEINGNTVYNIGPAGGC